MATKQSIFTPLVPSVPYYTFYLPNADTIVTVLPFILFGLLLLTAIFASFISYQQLLFVPDKTSEISYSDWWMGLIPFIALFLFSFLSYYVGTTSALAILALLVTVIVVVVNYA
jgi:hypothetical protein